MLDSIESTERFHNVSASDFVAPAVQITNRFDRLQFNVTNSGQTD